MSEPRHKAHSSPIRLAAAHFSLYFFWGATYLFMRLGVDTIPPFLLAGVRQLLAGVILYSWARGRGALAPVRRHWLPAFVVGALMLLIGNGLVTWSVQIVPTGVTSLIIAAMPLWVAFFDWLHGGGRPTPRVIAGLLLGFSGIAILSGPAFVGAVGSAPLIGILALVLASVSWAVGTLYSRRADLPSSLTLATSMSMIGGGVLLLLAGLPLGEFSRLDFAAIAPRSYLGVGYLVVFGSIIGFSSYQWLLRATSPASAASYAFVNPVVALFLGWLVLREPLSLRILIAAAVIILSIILVLHPGRRAPQPTPSPHVCEEI